MELLKEIHDVRGIEPPKAYRLRKAARAVLFNEKNEIALLYVSKDNYHKLPGGGIDDGEDIPKALARELKEEVGCEAEVIGEVGIVIEYRDRFELLQISYCYLAKVKGEICEPDFTESELARGFEIKWLNIDEALEKFQKIESEDYEAHFIVPRDLTLIQKAKELNV